ncbi:MAG: hypothetical protein L0J76_04115 [Tetragenococcus halophilus]|nr:hypothetical protein [Tetragenococcus halophilus]
MEYLLEVHPGHTLLVIGALSFVAGMFFTVWLDDQYRKEEKEREVTLYDGENRVKDFR